MERQVEKESSATDDVVNESTGDPTELHDIETENDDCTGLFVQAFTALSQFNNCIESICAPSHVDPSCDDIVVRLRAMMERSQQALAERFGSQNESSVNWTGVEKSFSDEILNNNSNGTIDRGLKNTIKHDFKKLGLNVPPKYPKMSDEMLDNIAEYFKKTECVRSKATTGITRESMIDLNLGREVDSDIINKKMELIQMRSSSSAGKLPSIFVLPDHVFSFLYNFRHDGVDDAFATDVDAYSMFKSDLIMFPLHYLEGNHWALSVVDLRYDDCIMVKYYDSIIERGYEDQKDRATASLELIKKYLEEARNRSKLLPDVLNREWKREIARNVPQQGEDNMVDCGIFIMEIADYLSYELDLNFNQSHMQYFRKVIVWELRNERLFLMPQQATVET